MNYSKTAVKTLPFLGKCLIFTVLCWNFVYRISVPCSPLTDAENGILTALILAFFPGRVTSFSFLASAELAVLFLIYDLFYGLARLTGIQTVFLTITLDGGIVPLVCALHLLYGVISAKRIAVTLYKIPTDYALPGGRLRILQISDLHPGRLQTPLRMKRFYAVVEKYRPDMIVLTGDIFDEFTRMSKFKEYCRFFAETKSMYGTWYVFGNHDAQWHWRRPAHTREDILRSFAEAGVRILEDECAFAADGRIRIAGRKDAMEDRMTPEQLLAEAMPGILTVVLCHEPVELTACAEAGADVIFAGHTHGGQIFPLGRLMKYAAKAHEMNGGMREILPGRYAVVSRGTGTWGYPVRTEGKSEIVIADIEGEP
ncbi:MAG: metallophosphoesterase [Clostridia bacterium]|nr:metallophosphoesterase [Clostridia bacterium]